MPTSPSASILDVGKLFILRNPSMTNIEIARHLTGSWLVEAGMDIGGDGDPPGSFHIHVESGNKRLVAIRLCNEEIVVIFPFHSSLGRAMLAIADQHIST